MLNNWIIQPIINIDSGGLYQQTLIRIDLNWRHFGIIHWIGSIGQSDIPYRNTN